MSCLKASRKCSRLDRIWILMYNIWLRRRAGQVRDIARTSMKEPKKQSGISTSYRRVIHQGRVSQSELTAKAVARR